MRGWEGRAGGPSEEGAQTQLRGSPSLRVCSAQLSPCASLSSPPPPFALPFPSFSPPPPAAAAAARPRQFRPTGLPSPALSPRCPGPERSAAAQVGAPERGSHQRAQCPRGRAPRSKWGDLRGAVNLRTAPIQCRISQAEREVEVRGLGMRSVRMCEH